jgi:hypothetical protein
LTALTLDKLWGSNCSWTLLTLAVIFIEAFV